jgi:hypothetical protein
LDFATLLSLPAKGRRQFRQRDCGRFGQNLVAALIDIAKAEHDRLGFIFGEHERRQEETGPQYVTNPRLAIDGSALGDEVGDVPIKCALGNPKLVGKGRRRHRATAPAQRLQEHQQSGGSRHDNPPRVGSRTARQPPQLV